MPPPRGVRFGAPRGPTVRIDPSRAPPALLAAIEKAGGGAGGDTPKAPAAAPRYRMSSEGPKESQTQVAVAGWFRAALPREAEFYADLSGIFAGDTDRGEARDPATQARLKRQFAAHRARGWRPGRLDTEMIHAGVAHLVELKEEDATYSAISNEQRHTMLRLMRAGARVGVARHVEEVEALYLLWGVPLRKRLPDFMRRPPRPPGSRARQAWPIEGEALRAWILRSTAPELLRAWGFGGGGDGAQASGRRARRRDGAKKIGAPVAPGTPTNHQHSSRKSVHADIGCGRAPAQGKSRRSRRG